uniref:Uncharacterized protein n=1 Tax=Rhizophagus irregularis (strain DAOM 181602 / DAOM 197198 / MUCL 43194) TaxID=747089 RepID=U9TZA4_RHIID
MRFSKQSISNQLVIVSASISIDLNFFGLDFLIASVLCELNLLIGIDLSSFRLGPLIGIGFGSFELDSLICISFGSCGLDSLISILILCELDFLISISFGFLCIGLFDRYRSQFFWIELFDHISFSSLWIGLFDQYRLQLLVDWIEHSE